MIVHSSSYSKVLLCHCSTRSSTVCDWLFGQGMHCWSSVVGSKFIGSQTDVQLVSHRTCCSSMDWVAHCFCWWGDSGCWFVVWWWNHHGGWDSKFVCVCKHRPSVPNQEKTKSICPLIQTKKRCLLACWCCLVLAFFWRRNEWICAWMCVCMLVSHNDLLFLVILRISRLITSPIGWLGWHHVVTVESIPSCPWGTWWNWGFGVRNIVPCRDSSQAE